MSQPQPQPRRRPGRPGLFDDGPRPLVLCGTAADNTAAVHLDAARQALSAARAILTATERVMGELSEWHRTAPPAPPPVVLDPLDPRWATAREAAAHCHVTVPMIARWRRQWGAAVRMNHRMTELRVSLADLDAWLAGQDA